MRWLRPALILTLVSITTVLHYGTPTEHLYLHEIYQRIYYIPIVLAAFWYGPWGGVGAATLTSLYYGFHIREDWAHDLAYSVNQYAEIVLFYVVGLITGVLAERQRAEERKLQAATLELRSAYDELQRTSQQLRQSERLAALGALTAGVAHEIRNPLGSIKGAVEIIERSLPASFEKRDFVQIIQEEIRRLDNTVTEFMRFGNPASTQLAPVELNPLIETTVKLLSQKAESSGVRIEEDLSSSLPVIQADADQLRHVLVNAIINGLEAMKDGGTLTILSRREAAGHVVVEVQDEGNPKQAAELERVFDPFYTTKPSGMGLGLAISHQLIANHSGSIALVKNKQRGMTLRIELPIRPPSVPARPMTRTGS